MSVDVKKRSRWQLFVDTVLFPVRALFLIENDHCGLSSLRSDRFYYCASQVQGYCLDVGCGKENLFIKEYVKGNGKGVDVFAYEGLTQENLVKDLSHFPFADQTFRSITFIANINHIPASLRDVELAEAYRCLQEGGNIIITMGSAFTEIMAHSVVWLYDKLFKTRFDVDHMRGMHVEEAYYLSKKEIISRMEYAGFRNIKRKKFSTQWGLNAMFIGWKSS